MTKEKEQILLRTLPEERRQQLGMVHSEKGRRQSAAGEWLLRSMLSEVTKEAPESFLIHREEGKKPFLVNCPFYFSISHAEAYVMAAVGDCPLGADIERTGRDARKALQKVCSAGDRKLLEEGRWKPALQMEIWTRKEALVKCLGCGIWDPRMKQTVGRGVTELELPEGRFQIWSENGPEGYQCALCRQISR